MERDALRDEEIETLRWDGQVEEQKKRALIRAMKMKSVVDVLEEVEVHFDTHFFNKFSQTKSSLFLKKVISNKGSIEMRLLNKTWRTLNLTQKLLKVVMEIHENLLCVWKRKELITKKPTLLDGEAHWETTQRQACHKQLEDGEPKYPIQVRYPEHPPEQHPRPERTHHL